MIPCSQDFLTAMKSPIKQAFLKFEFYDSKMNYINEFTKQITNDDIGSISVDSSRPIRRNFSFTLLNKNNEFTWGEDKLLWIDKRVKTYTGLKLRNGNIEYIPQGVFILSEPQDSHTQDGKKTVVSGQDKMFLYTDKRGKFKFETTVEVGVNIGTAIKTLAAKTGETQFNFDTVTETVPYTLTYQPNDNLYQAISDLALLAKCQVYYDVFGFLRLKKIDLNDFDSQPVTWSYKYNDPNERFYAGNVRKMDESQLANHIYVCGGSSQTATCSYELVVTETKTIWKDSPYSIERLGDILYLHNDGNPDGLLTTKDECFWRAKFELRARLGYAEKLSLSISPNYLHDVYDVIEIDDPENNVSGKYLLESFSLPLKPDLMSCECIKYRKVIDNWDFIPMEA
ncbi:hypothetical protein [Paenibacillus sp. XY044]|uniref:hypothetical protein n=1 Tax=Paenibacillus sp. XY044 TaxID=2026089 RepID=UPI000B99660C|nr:hypothetical protein [Paenibacillus sp. XY044]OZB98009.1 hypothetical protein CJP46_02260 [Paenibacillus sp. XY044]